jgi:hypothetical protein
MAEAHTKDGNFAGHAANEVDGDAGFLWRAGTGREDDAVGIEGFDFFRSEFVVTADFDVGAEFAHVLDEVPGEGVIVIEYEDHGTKTVFLQCSSGFRTNGALRAGVR